MQLHRTHETIFESGLYSVSQIKHRGALNVIMDTATEMKRSLEKRDTEKILAGFRIGLLFNQPSTRTFLSFEAAARILGADVVSLDTLNSSQLKGETLADTVLTMALSGQVDLIVLRDPSPTAAQEAQAVLEKHQKVIGRKVLVINAGNGSGEHPTQALLDVYTLLELFGEIAKLNMAFVGDLLYGRTTHSLGLLLSRFFPENQLNLISPEQLKMPTGYVNEMRSNGLSVCDSEDLDVLLPKLDMIYMTRLQEEWFKQNGQLELYKGLKGKYLLNPENVSLMKEKAKILHAFPRNGEIDPRVDTLEQNAYLQQMGNGPAVRMALLYLMLRA